MKKFIMTMCILKIGCAIAQTAPNVSYIPSGLVFTSPPANLQGQNSVVVGLGGYNASGSAQVTVEGVNYVKAMPGYQAKAFTSPTGYAKLQINKNLPRIVSFHSSGFSAIPKYDRFEIGVNLPASIQSQIDAFISSGSNGQGRINPYDFDQIRIECLYSLQGSNPFEQHVRHGFYEANTISVNASNDWDIDPRSDYPFRIRFAPPKTGYWKGVVTVYIGSNPQPVYTSYDFGFNVTPSNNPGHLAVSTNTQVQKMIYQDNGKAFYGIGRNVCYAIRDPVNTEAIQYCPGEYIARPSAHTRHRNYLTDLGENGCNFARVRLDKWSVPIEEAATCASSGLPATINDLTNFSSKEKHLWEMDRTLAVCESYGIHLLLTLLIEEEFHYNNWSKNPYSALGGSRNDFFLNPNYKQIFKKRLDYIEARWGYSTSIAAWEMFNETEFLAGGNSSNDPWAVSTATMVGDWLCEMRTYLQDLIKIYPKHLVTNGVSRTPWTPDPLNWHMDTCLDLYTDHLYSSELSTFPNSNTGIYHSNTKDLQALGLFYSNYWNVPQTYPPTGPFHKPHLIGETGLSDGSADRNEFLHKFSPLTFHNQNWGSLFSNSASLALQLYSWEVNALPAPTWANAPQPNPFHKQYKAIKAFVQRIDFNTLLLPDRNTVSPFWRPPQPLGAYLPAWEETDTSRVQTYWMKTQASDTIYGWTKNTAANFMNDVMTDGNPSVSDAQLEYSSWNINFASNMNANYYNIYSPNPPAITLNANVITGPIGWTVVQNLQPFTVYNLTVFDTWDPSGNPINTTANQVTTDFFGRLAFRLVMSCTPPTILPSGYYPDYAFIAIKSPIQPRNTGTHNSSETVLGTTEDKIVEYKNVIYPVPASNKVYLKFDQTDWTDLKVFIIDELGKVTEKNIANDNSIDTRDFSNGFYTLKMKDQNHEQLFKLIIQH